VVVGRVDERQAAHTSDKGWLAEGDGPSLVVMCAPQ